MRKPAEPTDDVAVPARHARGWAVRDGVRAPPIAPGRPGPRNGRTADRRKTESCARPRGHAPRRLRDRATSRASASVAYIRGVPRKALRGNWSSSSTSANAPSAVASHSPARRVQPPRARAGSARESGGRTRHPWRTTAPGPASRQKSTTAPASATADRVCGWPQRDVQRSVSPTPTLGGTSRPTLLPDGSGIVVSSSARSLQSSSVCKEPRCSRAVLAALRSQLDGDESSDMISAIC